MSPERIDEKHGVQLLHYLYDRGMTAIHSSSEYESHSYFCRILRQFRKEKPNAQFDHIAKIAAPHFDERRFETTQFRQLVERQLEDLGAEHISVVQWLVRSDPINDYWRIKVLNECVSELLDVVDSLQRDGKMGILVSFPYSDAFATEVLNVPACKGLANYLNYFELDSCHHLSAMRTRGQGYIAIRPLGGGYITSRYIERTQGDGRSAENFRAISSYLEEYGLLSHDLTKLAIRFPLMHPSVASVVVSINDLHQAQEILDAAENAGTNVEMFDSICSFFQGYAGREATTLKESR